MKKIIKEVKDGVAQITTVDERWYIHQKLDKRIFYPSVTWITGYYPKGIAFYKWLADKGWDEAEALKVAAGDKGSKVHAAVADLLSGAKITMDSKYTNPSTGQLEELTLEEYEAIMSFVDWHLSLEGKFKFIEWEFVLMPPEDFKHEEFCETQTGSEVCTCAYAGSCDLLVEAEDCFWIIDNKTSKYIWPDQELQVEAYRNLLLKLRNLSKPVKIAILQLGYGLNRKGYKFTEITPDFESFQAAQRFWYRENARVKPKQKDFPEVLQLSKVVPVETKTTKTTK